MDKKTKPTLKEAAEELKTKAEAAKAAYDKVIERAKEGVKAYDKS